MTSKVAYEVFSTFDHIPKLKRCLRLSACLRLFCEVFEFQTKICYNAD